MTGAITLVAETSGTSCGAVSQIANGSTIENCKNYANINFTSKGWAGEAGGLVGLANAYVEGTNTIVTKIQDCDNFGTITHVETVSFCCGYRRWCKRWN